MVHISERHYPENRIENRYVMAHRYPGQRIAITRPIIFLGLVTYALIVVYPMFWVLCTSLKSNKDIFLDPFGLPSMGDLQWSNYAQVWTAGSFGNYFFNSVIITSLTVLAVVLLSAMVAHLLSRFVFWGCRALLFYFLAGLMVPIHLSIVPLFFEMRALGLLNSRLGLWLAYVAFSLPFAIFILTGFFRSLPVSLHESARVDGAGEFRAFWHVMMPLARPGMVTVAIFTFLGTWNEFFMAFMFLSGEGSQRLRTLPLGLANITMVSQYSSDWSLAFAGLVVVVLPTLGMYLLLQKQLSQGVTVGAVKI